MLPHGWMVGIRGNFALDLYFPLTSFIIKEWTICYDFSIFLNLKPEILCFQKLQQSCFAGYPHFKKDHEIDKLHAKSLFLTTGDHIEF